MKKIAALTLAMTMALGLFLSGCAMEDNGGDTAGSGSTGSAGNNSSASRFGPLLQGDFPLPLLSASHRTGGSLYHSGVDTRPFHRVFLYAVDILSAFSGNVKGDGTAYYAYFIQSSRNFNFLFRESVI